MRLIRFAAIAPLFLASSAFAFGDMNQPGVGPGTLVQSSSYTATDCIKTDSSGTQFQANCDNGQDVVVGASGLSVGGQSIVGGSSTVKGASSFGGDLSLQNGETIGNGVNGQILFTGDLSGSGQAVVAGSATIKGASSLLGTITLQNGETIANSTNGEILQTGDSVVSGQAIIKGSATIDSSSGLSVAGCIKTDADGVEFNANCTAGKVGIGTATPGEVLDVSGNGVVRGAFTVAGGSITVSGDATFDGMLFQNDVIRANSGQNLILDGGGTGGGIRLRYGAGSGVAVFVNGSDGKVGVGNNFASTPQAELDVAGAFQFGSGATRSTGTATGDMYMAGFLRLASKTEAELLAITPAAVGHVYFCSDCAPAKVVVSTGTGAGNFADAIGGEFK